MKPLTVLAWDTATPWCGLALERFDGPGQGRGLGRFTSSEGTHSQMLPVQAARLLAEAGLTPADLDLVAVGRGPGSFTGLRTGLALAKGLAMGAGRPVLGLSTLEVVAAQALAEGLAPDGLVAPVVDARHQQIFTALYQARPGGGYPLECLAEPRPIFPADLPAFLAGAASDLRITVAGPALELVRKAWLPAWPGRLIPAPVAAAPEAFRLADLARILFEEDPEGAPDRFPPIPLYIRQPDLRKSGVAMR